MESDLHPVSKPERKLLPSAFATVVFIAIFVILTLLLGRSMVEHRFFEGGRTHQNGSVGQ